MSRRLQVTLPDPAADELAQLAAHADQPPGRLAGTLLQKAIAQARRSGIPLAPTLTAAQPTAQPAASAHPASEGQRPPWLPPYENDHAWRALTWGAIAALHSRYPRQLHSLQEDWWQDCDLLERLSALACWREQLDQHATDPREELYFHDALATFANHLAQQPASQPRWDPNVIPSDW